MRKDRGASVIVTARTAPEEETNFFQVDRSIVEGTTKVINEILNRFHSVELSSTIYADHRRPAAASSRYP
jgi:hypothetical protein